MLSSFADLFGASSDWGFAQAEKIHYQERLWHPEPNYYRNFGVISKWADTITMINKLLHEVGCTYIPWIWTTQTQLAIQTSCTIRSKQSWRSVLQTRGANKGLTRQRFRVMRRSLESRNASRMRASRRVMRWQRPKQYLLVVLPSLPKGSSASELQQIRISQSLLTIANLQKHAVCSLTQRSRTRRKFSTMV